MRTLETGGSLDLDLARYLLVLNRRWLPAVGVFALTVSLAFVAASLQKPSYTAEAKLLFKIDRTSLLTGLGEGVGELNPLVQTQNPLTTQVEIISSRPILEQVINNLNLVNEEGEPLSSIALKRQLEVKVVGGADVLQLAYNSTNPNEAAAVVNELAKVYIETNAETNQDQASNARELLENQLPQATDFVRESEIALRNFKEANRVVALNDEARSVVTVLQGLDTQILNARAELDEAIARSTQLRDSIGLDAREAMVVSDLSQAPGVQGVLKELQEVERELALQQSFYTEESPVVRNQQSQVIALRDRLREEVATIVGSETQVPERFLQIGQQRQALIGNFLEAEATRLSLAQRLSSLTASRATYKARADVLPRLEQQQSELERQLEVARLNYQTLLQRLKELQIAEHQAVGNARLLEEAVVPETASKTKKMIILALGGLLGAFLATTTVFWLELKDVPPNPTEMIKAEG